MDQIPGGTLVPAFRQVAVARDGRIWVERWPLPSDGNQVWWIFGIRGQWLGTVEMPNPLELLEVGPDYLVSRRRDELDIERVETWTLQSGG